MIFSFILILSTMQMVLQISKILIQADTFTGQLIHKVEVVQFHSVKKVSIWLESLWAHTENLLQSIVLLFSKPLENKIVSLKVAMEWKRV